MNGTAVELNSNGIRRCGEVFPALPLVERARALGLPITLGSDAHVPRLVGSHFDDLVAWAKRAGYDEASTFVGRKTVVQVAYALCRESRGSAAHGARLSRVTAQMHAARRRLRVSGSGAGSAMW